MSLKLPDLAFAFFERFASGTRRLYNYGMFDFAQKNFFLNFARGRMLYRIDVDDPADEFPIYRDEGRWIVEQNLNLTPAQRAMLDKWNCLTSVQQAALAALMDTMI